MNFLILDVGTSSMRGILFREDGTMLHTVQKEYQVITLEHGWVEQNPLDFKDSMTQIVKESAEFAAQEEESIDVVALTSQRSSVIPVDREGNHLGNAQMWQDKRTVPLCQAMEEHHREIFQLCGSRVNPVFSGAKMKWMRQNQPDLYEKAYKLTVIPDYLVYHMTGNFYTDYTYGSRSLLMNLKTCRWDPRLLELFEVDEEKLCELKAPGSILGYTTKEFAEQTGLKEGVPVISAGGDQQCAALGLVLALWGRQLNRLREPAVLVVLVTAGLLLARYDTLVFRELCVIDYPDATYSEVARVVNRAEAAAAQLDEDDTVYYVNSTDNGLGWFRTSFALLPNILSYSHGGGDISAASGAAICRGLGEFAAELAKCDYLYIDEASDSFWEGYASLFADGGRGYREKGLYLYRISVSPNAQYRPLEPDEVDDPGRELSESGEVLPNEAGQIGAFERVMMLDPEENLRLIPVEMEVPLS